MPISLSDLNIKINVEPYGTLELLEFVLKDMDWLDNAKTKELSARTFAVALLHNHLVSPTLDAETISGWSDELLIFVVTRWLKNQQQSEDTSEIVWSFEELKRAVYEHHEELVGPNRKLFGSMLESTQWFTKNLKSVMFSTQPLIGNISGSLTLPINLTNGIGVLGSQLSPTSRTVSGLGIQTKELMTGFASVYESISFSTQLFANAMKDITQMPKLNFVLPKMLTQQLFAGLPDFTEWERFLKESRKSNEAFDQAGYGFTNHLVSYTSIRRFTSINAQVRNAVITNSMASETRSNEFEEHLHQLFQRSSVLLRRWKIVSQALHAHRRRDYCVSVPPLLAQIEGIIGDALILKNLVHREGNKLYLKENGQFKRKRNNDRIEANGLHSLIIHSKWKDDATLQGVAELITSQLAQERNGVMHGRKTNYGTAKLSVQGLLLLLVLATMFEDLDNGRV